MPVNRMLSGLPFAFSDDESEKKFAANAYKEMTQQFGGRRVYVNVKGEVIEFIVPKEEQIMDFVRLELSDILNGGRALAIATLYMPSRELKESEVGLGPVCLALFPGKFWITLVNK